MGTPTVLRTDGYKLGHLEQYPAGTNKIYSNLTARKSRMEGIDHVVFVGLQYYLKEYLQPFAGECQHNERMVGQFKRRCDHYLGKDVVSTEHIVALKKLGYLPVEIKALPEGSIVPLQTPMFTITNTHPDYFWLVNFLETLLSKVWFPCTVATIAHEFYKIGKRYGEETCDDLGHLQWQFHDFSYRGISSEESAAISGAMHLLSFTGTDTLTAIDFLEDYYGANCEKELIGASVAATEHSVMCMGTKEAEFATYVRLITETYPSGILSIVSDTWDYWKVLTGYLPALREVIMAREGKIVIRPDSSPKTPLEIICGDPDEMEGSPARVGSLELLWHTFGGTTNAKGYRVLHPSIGLIYGDSITPVMATRILTRMKEQGFAASNVVFGPGAVNYQWVTRDTYGFAVKATYGEVNGNSRSIEKDPITDKSKKSHCGLLQVVKEEVDGVLDYRTRMGVSEEEEACGELQTVFKNGIVTKAHTLAEIRERLK